MAGRRLSFFPPAKPPKNLAESGPRARPQQALLTRENQGRLAPHARGRFFAGREDGFLVTLQWIAVSPAEEWERRVEWGGDRCRLASQLQPSLDETLPPTSLTEPLTASGSSTALRFFLRRFPCAFKPWPYWPPSSCRYR